MELKIVEDLMGTRNRNVGLAKGQIHFQSTFFGRKHVSPDGQNMPIGPLAKFWPYFHAHHFFENIKNCNENARFQPIFKFNELSLKATKEGWPSGQM